MIPIILSTRIITIKCIKSTVCWFVFVDIETKMPLYKKKTFPVSSIKFLLKMVLVLHQTIHASKIVHYIYSKKSIMLGLTSSHISSSPWVESNQSKVTCFDLITLAGEATRFVFHLTDHYTTNPFGAFHHYAVETIYDLHFKVF